MDQVFTTRMTVSTKSTRAVLRIMSLMALVNFSWRKNFYRNTSANSIAANLMATAHSRLLEISSKSHTQVNSRMVSSTASANWRARTMEWLAGATLVSSSTVYATAMAFWPSAMIMKCQTKDLTPTQGHGCMTRSMATVSRWYRAMARTEVTTALGVAMAKVFSRRQISNFRSRAPLSRAVISRKMCSVS